RFDDFAREVTRAIATKQIPDDEQADNLASDLEKVRDGARVFFGRLQLMRFDAADARLGQGGSPGNESRVRVTAKTLEPAAHDTAALGRRLGALDRRVG